MKRRKLRKRYSLLAASLLLAIFMVAGVLFMQDDQEGTIDGIVRSLDDEPLSGVIVLLRSPALPLPDFEAITDATGRFCFTSLPSGVYELIFLMKGTEKNVYEGIVIQEGKTYSAVFHLGIDSGANTFIGSAGIKHDIAKYRP